MLFQYKAIKDGKVISRTIEADNEQSVISYLRENNYFPIKIANAKSVSSKLRSYSSVITDRVSPVDIIDFTRQLSIMLNAGLTIVDALQILEKQITKRSMIHLIATLDEQIRAGYPFSAALKKFPNHFPGLYVALVRAGEASGKMNDILMKLAETMEKDRELRGKLKNALIYPLIIFISMFIVMFIVVTFVLPKLLTLYKDFNVEFTLSTQILVAVSGFSEKYWHLILISIVAIVFLIRKYLKTRHGRYIRDVTLLKLPVIKNTYKMASLVDNVRTLSLMVGAGVPILDSLNIIIETTNNVVFQNAFQNTLKSVERGMALGDAFSSEDVFPPILVQMTKVGENTGQLDFTLSKLAAYFEVETELALKNLTAMVEPAILIVLGIAVGVLVISVITPIYNLTGSLQ